MSFLAKCGKFGSYVDLKKASDFSLRKKTRIWSAKPNGCFSSDFVVFATDGEYVFNLEGLMPIRSFLAKLSIEQRRQLLVLTKREVDIILPLLVEFDAMAIALEVAFPVFDDIKYGSSLHRRLTVLKSKVAMLRKIGVRGRGVTGGGCFHCVLSRRACHSIQEWFR